MLKSSINLVTSTFIFSALRSLCGLTGKIQVCAYYRHDHASVRHAAAVKHKYMHWIVQNLVLNFSVAAVDLALLISTIVA
jgi:hypothetical protein